MVDDILDQLPMYIDHTPIAQALDVVSTGFHRPSFRLGDLLPCPIDVLSLAGAFLLSRLGGVGDGIMLLTLPQSLTAKVPPQPNPLLRGGEGRETGRGKQDRNR